MAVRQIGTDIKLIGEKEFNDAMKSINSNLKTLKTDMAAVSAEFDENSSSVEALTEKNKILQDTYEQQRVKVDALRQMYERVAEAAGENSYAADKMKQDLNSATVAVSKAEKALRQNEDALEKAKSAASGAEEAVENLADATAEVARTADRAADELDDMGDEAERTGNILPGVVQGLGGLASGALQAGAAVVTLGAAMGTAAITALAGFAKDSAEAAKAAAEAGETLTETQTDWLAYADKLSTLDTAASAAKRALGGVLLPQLSALSTDGAAYLNNFAQSMEEAAGDTKKQAAVLGDFLVEGVRLLKANVPEYIELGKDLWGGIKEGIREIAPELADEGIDLVFDLLESILDNADELGAGGEMLFDKLKAGLEDRGPELIASAASLLGRFVTGLTENATELIPVAGTLILALVNGMAESLPELGTAAGEAIAALVTYLLDPDNMGKIVDAALRLGSAFATALWNAAKEIFFSLVDLNEMFGPISGDLGLDISTGNFSPALNVPGYADGLERVPYDNYLARLHKDEMVLTAAEAALYRSGRGQGSGKVGVIENLTIYTQHLSQTELDAVLDYINRKLGEAM